MSKKASKHKRSRSRNPEECEYTPSPKRSRRQEEYENEEESVAAEKVLIPGAASSAAENTEAAPVDHYGAKDYSKLLDLKGDHTSRPIWVAPDGHIFLEAFSPVYRHARDFLIAIAVPVCRPQHIHEFRLTAYSLYAAVSVGLQTKDIIEYLKRLCKTSLPAGIEEFIKECTLSYGKVKLVLKQNRYFVESTHPEVMKELLRDPVIQQTRLMPAEDQENPMDQLMISDQDKAHPIQFGAKPPGEEEKDGEEGGTNVPSDIYAYLEKMDRDEDDTEDQVQIMSFEIKQDELETLQKRCIEKEYPLLAEYDFRHDTHNPDIKIDLKPSTILRPYQCLLVAAYLE